jgi:hypothetical protein
MLVGRKHVGPFAWDERGRRHERFKGRRFACRERKGSADHDIDRQRGKRLFRAAPTVTWFRATQTA